MSLSGALSSAISALAAQSSALSMISDNISNVNTTGYKTTSAMFNDLVTASSSSSAYSAGGVSVSGFANITQQGLLAATTTTTNVAIQGAGFFVTTDALGNGSTFYTRNGAFAPDASGFLVNNGFYLEGWRTDSSGNIVGSQSASNLQPVNTQVATTSAAPSTKTSIAANLPSDAAAGATFTSSMTIYDSLGNPASIQITWTKDPTATNQWTATFADPTSTTDTSTPIGTIGTANNPLTITFNSDGSLATPTTAPTISVTGWTDGAADSNVALNLGTPGKTDGLTQNASGETSPSVNVRSIVPDGFAFGTLSGISIGKNGMVNATYSNGNTIPIYQLAVATFPAPNSLNAHSGGMYSATIDSGNANLQTSGTNGAGIIFGSELESSTTDTSGQFSNMISAQQAYSAASQVVTTVNKMFDTLISAMR
jgi:flagellar hook protein FlgE